MHRLFNRFGGLLLVAQFFMSTCITPGTYAQEATTDLNLADTNATISAQLGGATAATLQVSDGSTLNITSGTLLTPAQNLALQQVLAGQQNLQINNLGQAVGGGFQIPIGASQNISSLIIPQGVTGVQDFAVGGLNLTGNFQNSGNFYGYSSSATTTTANIAANNIINDQNAILSTLLPSGGLAALGFSVNSAVSNLSLNLSAINNIINSGAIYSAGNLTASAGGSIINALPAGVTGISPVMQAMNNVNLISNNITNTGIINSQLANINIAGMLATNLLINNIGGRMEALTGAINVRDQLFTTKHDLNILGGDLISQELNLFSGDGIVNMNVQEVTGLINVNAGIAHLKAATPLMQIGNISLTGDPTFYNSLGDLSVGDLNFSGQDLALVASGNIVVNGAITTAGTAGGDVLVFAGAKFEDDFSSSQLPDEPYQSSTIRVIGVFEGRTISIFDTNGISIDSTGSGGDGGNVTLVADGHISVANRIITGGAENSGNVTVISKTGINVRDIDTSGNLPPGGITTGNMSLLTYQPSIKSGILEVTNGTIINSGGFDTVSRGLVSANGTIAADDLKTSGGGIFLRAGDTIEVDNVRASSPDFGGFIVIEAHQVTDSANPFIVGASVTNDGVRGVIESTGAFGGGISISSDATGGITIESWNNITVAASGGIGGEISVSANNGPLNIGGGTINLNGVGSGGGEFSLQSASTLTITNNLVVNVNGDGDSSGGDINIQAAILNLQGSLTTNINSSGSGDGGDISVDGVGGTLQIVGPGSLTINANSAGEGAGGIIEVEASFNMGGDLTLKADGGMFGGEIVIDTNQLTAGNITITANQGFFEGPRGFGGEIEIGDENGNLTINTGSLLLSANTVNHTAGDIILSARDISITAGTISLNANASGNGNGGFVSLSGDKFTASSVIQLNANGSGTGFGGEVNVATLGADGDITVGSAAGQVQVSVTGGSAGSESGDAGVIIISSGRSLTVNPNAITAAPLGHNGVGAWIKFTSSAAGNDGILTISGPIIANGKGVGSGGRIELIARASGPGANFTIDSEANNVLLSATGGSPGSAAGNGGTIILESAGGLKIDSNQITVNALGINGDGGALEFVSGDGGNKTLQIIGGLAANGVGTGSGGTVKLLSQGTGAHITINSSNPISATGGSSGSLSGNGGNIEVQSAADLTVTSNQIKVDALGNNGNGGTIKLVAGSGGPGNLQIIGELKADGVGTGSGGTIDLSSLADGANIEIGGASGIHLSVQSHSSGAATTSGGTLRVTANRDVTFSNDGIYIGVTPQPGTTNVNGNGGTVEIQSNTGIVKIFHLQEIDLSGIGSGVGGNVTITAKEIESVGIGRITASGGETGNGGTINLQSFNNLLIKGNLFVAADAGNGNTQSEKRGGTINIEAANNLVIEQFASISASTRQGSGNGGEIILRAGIDGVGALTVLGKLTADGFGNGSGGMISLTSSGNEKIIVDGQLSALAQTTGQAGLIIFSNIGGTALNVQIAGALQSVDETNIAALIQLGAPSVLTGLSEVSLSLEQAGSFGGSAANKVLQGPVTAYGSSVSIISPLDQDLSFGTVLATSGNIEIKLEGASAKIHLDQPNSSIKAVAGNILIRSTGENSTVTVEPSGTIDANGSLVINANTVINSGTMVSRSGAVTLSNLGVNYPDGTQSTFTVTNNGFIASLVGEEALGDINFAAQASALSIRGTGELNGVITGAAQTISIIYSGNTSLRLAYLNALGGNQMPNNEPGAGAISIIQLGPLSNPPEIIVMSNGLINAPGPVSINATALVNRGSITGGKVEILALGQVTNAGQISATNAIAIISPVIVNNGMLKADPVGPTTLTRGPGDGKIFLACEDPLTLTNNGSITSLAPLLFEGMAFIHIEAPTVLLIGSGTFSSALAQIKADTSITFQGSPTFERPVNVTAMAKGIPIAQIIAPTITVEAGNSVSFFQRNPNTSISAPLILLSDKLQNDGTMQTNQEFFIKPIGIGSGLEIAGGGTILASTITTGGGLVHIVQSRISSIDGTAGFLSAESREQVMISVEEGNLRIRNVRSNEQGIFIHNRGMNQGTISFETNSSVITKCVDCQIFVVVGTVVDFIPAPQTLPSQLVLSGNPDDGFFLGHGIQFTGNNNRVKFPLLPGPGQIIFSNSMPEQITLGGNVTFALQEQDEVAFNMSNPASAQQVAGLQNLGILGGHLNIAVDGSVSGDVIVTAGNVSSISELWIPNDVAVSFENYSPTTPLQIKAGTNPILYIGGSINFSNGIGQDSSVEILPTNSPILMISSAGIISSSSGLTLSLPNLVIDGSIAVSGTLTIASVDGLQLSGAGTMSASSIHMINSLNAVYCSACNFTMATPLTIISPTVYIDNFSVIAAQNIGIQTTLLTNDGQLSATTGVLAVGSNSGLMVTGTGTFKSENRTIGLVASAENVLTIGGALSFSPGSLGTVAFNYDPVLQASSNAAIHISENSTIVINNGAPITIVTSDFSVEDNSALLATGQSEISWYSNGQPKVLSIADGASFMLSSQMGLFNFGQFSRTSLTFAKTAGGSTSTINFLGGPLTTYTSQGNSVTIDPGVIINTNNNITFNIHDGGTFINNGTIQSSANGVRIFVDAFAYPITLTGSGTAKFTGAGGAFFVLTAGLGSINVNSTQNFDFSGGGGYVSFQAHTLNVMPGVQINTLNGGAFEFIGNTLNMGAQSSINTTTTSGTAISINAFNVLLPADSFATLSSLGGDIIATPRELAFTKAGGLETTLNLLGGKFITSSSVGPTLIDTGVTLASDNNISMQVFGSNQLILNGNITTSAPGASILITSSPIVTLTGSPASISATGGGNSTITILGFDNGLNINSSYSLNAGSDGIVYLRAPDGVMTIASGVNVAINGGSQLVIGTASLVMEANSKITIDKSTGIALAWGAEAHRSLKVSGPSDSSATIETAGGDINISGAGAGFPFTISKMPNSGETTLNLNGGNVALSALGTSLTIESGVTVASDKNILVSLTGSTFNNQGTLSLSNGGSLTINADAQSTIVNMGAITIDGGNMNVSSASNIVINDTIAMTGAGSLNISTLTGSNADIVVNANIGGSANTNLAADGNGNIAQNSGVISGTSVNLTSGSGNIGTEGQNITTNATALTANTTATGSVYITNNGSVDVGNSSAGETFQLTAVGNIKTLGIVSANNVVLQAAPGSGGGVFADPDIIGTTSITIRADGAGTITQLPGIRLVAPTVILESQDGDIGTATTSVRTVADTLIVRTGAAASAYVSEIDNVALDTSFVGQTFRLRAKGDITVVGNVAANDVRLITTSPTGAIIVTAAVTGLSNVTLRTKDSGNVVIDQTGNIATSNGSVLIRANDLKLDGTINAGTGQVTLRANGNKAMALADVADVNGNDAVFDVNASELSKITTSTLVIGDQQNTAGLAVQDNMNVSGTGAGNFDLTFRSGGDYTATSIAISLGDRSLDVNVDGTVSSGTVSANLGDIKLVGGNGITVVGAISTTGNITLNTSADGNGGIALQANVTSGSNLKLIAHGSGAITQTAGTLTANNLHLTSDNGNIGENSQPLNSNATKLIANTLGSVHVNEFDDLILGNSSTGGNFSVVAGGAVTVNNVLTQNGSILVSAGAGALTVGGQSVIFANEGNLHLQNRNTTSGAIVIGKDSILGANSASDTSLGNVYITIGDIPTAPTAGTPPSKVTVITANGGQAYFDTTGITAQGAQSTVDVNGRTVLFETGGLGASSIKLKGDVNITAGNPLEPIAFIHNAPYKSTNVKEVVYSTPLWLKTGSTDIIEETPETYRLTHGEVLLAPSRRCKLYAGGYEISVAAGAICLVEFNNEILVLRNLHENLSGSISITAKGQLFTLTAAREIVIGPSAHSIQNKLACQQIGRRHVHFTNTAKLHCASSEFSTISIMQNSKLVSRVINTSTNDAQRVRAKIVKTTACLMSLPSNKEPFKCGSPTE